MVWYSSRDVNLSAKVALEIVILYFVKSHDTPCPPPPQKKNCIGIVFDFSWDIFMSHEEKLLTIIMQNFGR